MPERKRRIDILDETEVRSLIQAAGPSATGKRNAALVALLYWAGLRVSEAVALRASDVDPASNRITVQRGKGAKRRVSRLFPEALLHLQPWIEERKRRKLPARGELLCTLEGEPVSRIYVAAMLKRLAERAGLSKRVHAHGLRHAHASHLWHRGASVAALQKQLGHRAPEITWAYLAEVAGDEALKELDAITWANEQVEQSPPLALRSTATPSVYSERDARSELVARLAAGVRAYVKAHLEEFLPGSEAPAPRRKP